MSVGGALASVALLVAANAFFVAAEFSLVGSRRTRLEEMAQAGNRRAVLAQKAIARLDRTISATQLGITLASLGLGWVGEPALASQLTSTFAGMSGHLDVIARHGVAAAIAFTFISGLHIILGELVPKALALVHSEEVATWLAAPLLGFRWLMWAPIAVLNGTSNALLNALGINPPGESERLHSPEELRMLVEQSGEGGSLHEKDARMLAGVFGFSEKSAEEVMTPRTAIVALDANLSVREAAAGVVEEMRSRYPVIEETLDEVIGVVHAKDILAALVAKPDATLRSVLRPAIFVPATKEVEDVLADMKRLKAHMVIVLDEHGGTLGLVTMEDLLEEIVGPISDEYDVGERAEPMGRTHAVVDGATPIAEFNEKHEMHLDDSYYNTVGGWVFGQLGRLPRPGDVVQAGALALEVKAMDGRRVASLLVRHGDAGSAPEAGSAAAQPTG
jgi:CBS domain containing-hemolysin-like protein